MEPGPFNSRKQVFFFSGKRFNTAFLFVLILISGFGCVSRYRESRQVYYKDLITQNHSFDAIIVPGIAYTKHGWCSLLKARVIWAWVLYKNGITKNVIFSGAAVSTPYHEAMVMGLYAKELGIPVENIFYDTLAKHSAENIHYAMLLAKKEGFKKIALASDFFQTLYLTRFIKKHMAGSIEPLPFMRDSIEKYWDISLVIDPRPAAVRDPSRFVALKEKESYLQRLRGTLGYNVNWEAHADNQGNQQPKWK